MIAFCGIDGSGKSTIVSKLSARLADHNIIPLRKTDRTNSETLYQAFPNDSLLDQAGFPTDLGRNMAVASLYDFLRYFLNHASPEIQKDQTILLDRWVPCVQSYAGEVLGASELVDFQLREVPVPDIVFNVIVPPEVAYNRIVSSRKPLRDESIRMLELFAAAYEKVLGAADYRVIPLENTTLDLALAKATRVILGG